MICGPPAVSDPKIALLIFDKGNADTVAALLGQDRCCGSGLPTRWPSGPPLQVQVQILLHVALQTVGVADPFLNLPGRDWNILDRETGTKAFDVAQSCVGSAPC